MMNILKGDIIWKKEGGSEPDEAGVVQSEEVRLIVAAVLGTDSKFHWQDRDQFRGDSDLEGVAAVNGSGRVDP